jgi:hypothetical protein
MSPLFLSELLLIAFDSSLIVFGVLVNVSWIIMIISNIGQHHDDRCNYEWRQQVYAWEAFVAQIESSRAAYKVEQQKEVHQAILVARKAAITAKFAELEAEIMAEKEEDYNTLRDYGKYQDMLNEQAFHAMYIESLNP